MSDQKNNPTNKGEQTPEARKGANQATGTAQDKNQSGAGHKNQPEDSDRVGGDAARTQAKRPEDSATQKPTGTAKPADKGGRH